MRTVHQLHCEAWPDMEAPKDTKVLLELYEEAEDVLSKNPDSTMWFTAVLQCSQLQLKMKYKINFPAMRPHEVLCKIKPCLAAEGS